MTVLCRLPDLIDRELLTVMTASCADDLAQIQHLWPWFEDKVGLRGRRMYAAAYVSAGTYMTCTPVRAGDDPQALGLEVGELPGGWFRRGRLRGDPPDLYASIAPGFEELEAMSLVDQTRPLIEFYKRHNEIELWVPTSGSGVD